MTAHGNELRGLGEAKEDLNAGKTLLERFEEDKKKVRPEVAEAGIMVLDALILRLKNYRSGLTKTIDDRHQEIKAIDKQIAMVQPNYDKVKSLHDKHIAERDQLQADVDRLTAALEENVKSANEILSRANRAHGTIRSRHASSMKDAQRGFTSSGQPLPGREVNLLKKPPNRTKPYEPS